MDFQIPPSLEGLDLDALTELEEPGRLRRSTFFATTRPWTPTASAGIREAGGQSGDAWTCGGRATVLTVAA
ncbi:hypothetical protein [Micromonospora chersina]|uniref:hypothetical protein n=1 Tax=Micromonospora chersina TaxID=47854 RepID=UPI003720327B